MNKHFYLQLTKALLPIVFLLLLNTKLFAQNVGINSTGAAPLASAMLDIDATNRGLLIPRVALTATNAAGPIAAPATSLLVYNNATAGVAPNNVTPGYYYWNGAAWVRFLGASDAWLTLGNAGTNAATNFIGTTDAVDWVIRTNNTERMRVQSGGNVGIGTNTPGAPLTIFYGDNTSPFPTPGSTAKGAINFRFPGFGYYSGITWGASTADAAHAGIYANSTGTGTFMYFATTNNYGTGPQTRMTIDNIGNIGIGTTTPAAAAKLDIIGKIKITDGTQAAGRILTSDATGIGTWVTPASIPVYGNNAQSVKLAVLVTNNNQAAYTDIPGMSITMTTVHNTFYVFSSFTARLDVGTGLAAQLGQVLADLQLVVDGVPIAWAGSPLTDYDDTRGVITTGTVAIAGFPVTIAPGLHTIKMQWKPTRLWSNNPWCIAINPGAAAADHCILTIFD